MAATPKVTFFVRYKQAGCSFSLYNGATSLAALIAYDPVRKTSIIDRFVQTYLRCLGKGAEMPYVRISDELIKGDSEFYDSPYTGVASSGTGDTAAKTRQVKVADEDNPDFYSTAVNVSLYASSTQKGRIFMRFVPDNVCNYPVGYNPNGNWEKAFDAWIAQVISDGWCIKALKDQVAAPEKKIKTITRTVSGANLLVTTDGGHGLSAGNKVRISRTTSTVGFKNGIYIADSTPTTDTLLLRNTPGTDLMVAKDGTIRLRDFEFKAITKIAGRGMTSRKAGRPFGSPVGRRRKKAV